MDFQLKHTEVTTLLPERLNYTKKIGVSKKRYHLKSANNIFPVSSININEIVNS